MVLISFFLFFFLPTNANGAAISILIRHIIYIKDANVAFKKIEMLNGSGPYSASSARAAR